MVEVKIDDNGNVISREYLNYKEEITYNSNNEITRYSLDDGGIIVGKDIAEGELDEYEGFDAKLGFLRYSGITTLSEMRLTNYREFNKEINDGK